MTRIIANKKRLRKVQGALEQVKRERDELEREVKKLKSESSYREQLLKSAERIIEVLIEERDTLQYAIAELKESMWELADETYWKGGNHESPRKNSN